MTEQHTTEALAQRIWDYMHLGHTLQPSDIILALGSNDTRVAEWATTLYLRELAPLLMFSGNVGMLTRHTYHKPEAEVFADIARQRGVPETALLLEPASTNTGENIAFSRRLLAERGLDPQRLILVQKPYMERRTYATFMNFWPGKEILVTSPPISFADYPTAALPRDRVINIMVGDLQRIREYPARGFQIPQPIPAEIWEAYEALIARGYDQHLIRD